MKTFLYALIAIIVIVILYYWYQYFIVGQHYVSAGLLGNILGFALPFVTIFGGFKIYQHIRNN